MSSGWNAQLAQNANVHQRNPSEDDAWMAYGLPQNETKRQSWEPVFRESPRTDHARMAQLPQNGTRQSWEPVFRQSPRSGLWEATTPVFSDSDFSSPGPVAFSSPGSRAISSPGPTAISSPGPAAISSLGLVDLYLDSHGNPSDQNVHSHTFDDNISDHIVNWDEYLNLGAIPEQRSWTSSALQPTFHDQVYVSSRMMPQQIPGSPPNIPQHMSAGDYLPLNEVLGIDPQSTLISAPRGARNGLPLSILDRAANGTRRPFATLPESPPMLDDFADPEEDVYVYSPPEFSGGYASRGVLWQPLVELKVPQSDASLVPSDLTDMISRDGQYPCAHGGFADVWKGMWLNAKGPRAVAIKVLKAPLDDPAKLSKLQKRLRRELCVWQRLKHKNVLVLDGIASNFGYCPGFVCPWLEHGSISKYLKKRGADLLMTHRLQLQVHALGVVHGDLTGANILIADDGSACLCDFGLSSIAAEFQGTSYITSTISGNVRWAAPELYHVAEDGAVPMVSTHSDAYSYGSVSFEILSGQIPFAYLREAQVIMQVYNGKKTQRPPTQDAPYVTDQLWAFMNQCWVETPTARPGAEQLLQSMQRFLDEID